MFCEAYLDDGAKNPTKFATDQLYACDTLVQSPLYLHTANMFVTLDWKSARMIGQWSADYACLTSCNTHKIDCLLIGATTKIEDYDPVPFSGSCPMGKMSTNYLWAHRDLNQIPIN